jgi:catechol 2,3-dioxygenase-like lactoylglutathione lyase family enzyme
MIDHVYISVSDPERSLAFYAAALAPLGYTPFGNYSSASGPESVPDLWGLGAGASSIWLRQRLPGETGLYLGLVATDQAVVNATYAAALEAGGTDDGAPAIRSHFADGYYAANIIDLDDNRLEIVNKSWN